MMLFKPSVPFATYYEAEDPDIETQDNNFLSSHVIYVCDFKFSADFDNQNVLNKKWKRLEKGIPRAIYHSLS